MSRNRITLDLRGLRELRRSLQTVARDRLIEAFAAALYDEGLKLDARAQEEDMSPWDTGRMKQSHYVSPPTEQGTMLICEMGYGVDYSIYVHERTELRHPHGQAKWLQKALGEFTRGFLERIGRKMERALELRLSVQSIPATAPTRPTDMGGGGKVLQLPARKS